MLGVGDVLVLEGELVRGRAARHLDVAVERLTVTGLDTPAAAGPQPGGDRSRDLGLARAGRAYEPEEARAAGGLHVRQRAGELVDRVAVQAPGGEEAFLAGAEGGGAAGAVGGGVG